MPEYKRKKVHTKKRRRANPSLPKTEINIPMSRSKREKSVPSEKSKIRIIPGKKWEKRKKVTVWGSAVACVAVIIAVLSFTLPVSIFESTKTLFRSFGHGGYPQELSGTSVVSTVTKDNYYYVLTDTSITAFSNGGKKIFTNIHGFSSPVIKTSKTRAIVFDQGKNTAIIYNLSGVLKTVNTKEPIVTANISKNGQYVLVTKSESYASCINVYNRHGKRIYNINLAKDIVNNVCICPSGDRIALSSIDAQAGKLCSSFKIYRFNSADSAFKLDLGEDVVYDIESMGRGFFVTTHNKVRFVHRSRFTVTENAVDGEIALNRYDSSGLLTVYNKTNDKSDNTVVYFSKRGKKIFETDIKHALNDIRFSGGRIYALGDGKVTIYDREGQMLSSKECGFSGKKISVTGSNTVCLVTDEDIQKITVSKR